jgi:Yip1 domain
MTIVEIIARAKAIMLTPHTEWQVIEREPGALTDLFGSYVAILAAIPALARFIGHSLIGGHDPMLHGLIRTVIAYAATFTVVYVLAGIIDLLAPKFGTQKNFPNALKLSIYSHTPLWLAGISLLIPGLNFLMLLGIYGACLLWVGLPPLMRVPEETRLLYTACVTACALVSTVVYAVI